jgi:hypothetical protein
MEYFLLPLLFLPCVLFGIAILFRRIGMPKHTSIFFAFLVIGIVLGLVSVFLWPGDLGVYLNLPGTAAGDWVYHSSIDVFGNPVSDQAHYTIPWILRIPQIYVIVSPLIYGAAGGLIQFVYNRIKKNYPML